jgi:hypothetical protein
VPQVGSRVVEKPIVFSKIFSNFGFNYIQEIESSDFLLKA